jgi:hypothetical protein
MTATVGSRSIRVKAMPSIDSIGKDEPGLRLCRINPETCGHIVQMRSHHRLDRQNPDARLSSTFVRPKPEENRKMQDARRAFMQIARTPENQYRASY